MLKLISYTLVTVLAVDLLATSGDITMTWPSPVLPKLYSRDPDVNPFSKPITTDEESWIGSLINIGAMIGPLPFGYASAKFGRKFALLAIAIPHIISYLTLAFARSVYLYYFARVLGGIAVGGGYTLLPMYVAEVAEDSNRGMLSVTLNIFWTFGNLIPYCLGPYVPIPWFNVILACVPTSFFILFLILAPETPYYLVSQNRMDAARKSLMKLRSGTEGEVETEIAHIKNVLEHDEHGHFMDLFKSRVHLKALGISLVLIIAQQLSGINAVLAYTQEIFEAAGTEIPSDISSIIVGLVIFSTSFVSVFLADRLGRRILLLISAVGMTIALGAFGVFFYLKSSTDVDVGPIAWLPIVSLVLYIITFNFGFGPLPWTVSSELFPAPVKSAAAAIVAVACWTTSFFVTRFFNDLNDAAGRGGTFWIFSGSCFAALIFTYFFVFETKGRSFKEIQEILEGKRERKH